MLKEFRDEQRNFVLSRHIEAYKRFEKKRGSTLHPDKLTEMAIEAFEKQWKADEGVFGMVPGKSALSDLNRRLQERCSINITPSSIISMMREEDIAPEMKSLIADLAALAKA